MLKSDKDRAECERVRASWDALRRNIQRMAKNYEIDASLLIPFAELQIQYLTKLVEQYNSLTMTRQNSEETDEAVIILRNVDKIGRSIIRTRIQSGLTQVDLARKANINPQALNRMERNSYASTGLGTIVGISKVLLNGEEQE